MLDPRTATTADRCQKVGLIIGESITASQTRRPPMATADRRVIPGAAPARASSDPPRPFRPGRAPCHARPVTDTPSPPDQAALHEAALAYLARYGATRRGLLMVLERRIGRWHAAARRTGADGGAIETARVAALAAARDVVERLVAAGAVDDAVFSAARASRLQRSGHSRRGIAAHLAGRGVAMETVAEALSDMDELGAALAFARRRRIGPFAPAPQGDPLGDPQGDPLADPLADPRARQRALALLARAGFPRAIAERALATPAEEAELTLGRSRR